MTKKIKQAKKHEWKEYIISHNPDAERNVADLVAHLMTNRFNQGVPRIETAEKWLKRIQKNTHFSHADVRTTEIMLDWYAERNPALREAIK